VILFGIWLWRTNREADPKRNRPKATAGPKPQDMVQCAQCSVHLAAVDAVPGKKGVYCCLEHRQRAEP